MREWALLLASVALTLAVALGAIRWLAPGLLGAPSEVRVVRVDERVVPFYDGVFRPEHRAADAYILDDPTVLVRARPFHPASGGIGPTDVLGFRNRAVPNRTRVVTIGDSQTYGTGVPIDAAWPHVLAESLGGADSVYDMSTGGWGAVQYLEMWRATSYFEPQAVVVAFYTGNDPRESFTLAYSVERFAGLRPDPALEVDDLPALRYPPPRSDLWAVRFGGGPAVTFTARLRLGSNTSAPAVAAGWEIMARVAETILAEARKDGPRVLFTIIPTKERVYAGHLRRAGAVLPSPFEQLVEGEDRYTARLTERIEAAGGVLVQVLEPLAREVMESPVYPRDRDGHMRARGHEIVAAQMLAALGPLLD